MDPESINTPQRHRVTPNRYGFRNSDYHVEDESRRLGNKNEDKTRQNLPSPKNRFN
jgi:hypothetical protein